MRWAVLQWSFSGGYNGAPPAALSRDGVVLKLQCSITGAVDDSDEASSGLQCSFIFGSGKGVRLLPLSMQCCVHVATRLVVALT